MRALPKAVAGTKVGKSVTLEIWRNKKLLSKRLILGRLESSKEFKKDNEEKKKTKVIETEVERLKILVRDTNTQDREKRKLKKSTRGEVIIDILNKSPLMGILNINDIIIEIQKKEIDTNSVNTIVDNIIKKGEKTVLLTIINENNRRRYIGVKIN